MAINKQLLTLSDEIFLNIEKRQQPMHVAGLQLFKYPQDAGPQYMADQVAELQLLTRPKGQFAKRITKHFSKAFWIEDNEFDLEHHFRRHALPTPGRIRELLAFVSAEHSNLMDKQRPLWEFHLIEGLPDNQFAIYSKLHHAMTDGMSAMRMMINALSPDPDLRHMPPLWANATKTPATNISDGLLLSQYENLKSVMATAGKQVGSLPKVYSETLALLRNTDSEFGFGGAPKSILNQKITGSRRYAAQSYSLDHLKLLGKKLNCTLNDIVLATCSGALRHYLISQNALPSQPLKAAVPVSLRADESVGGNQVGLMIVNLATHIPDPLQRFDVITRSISKAKQHFSSLSAEEAQNLTALMLFPTLLNFLTGMAPNKQAFNVIISNVPGPREPLYWNGAQMTGLYPVSIVLDQMALNITITSYNGSLEFGLTACRRSIPSMQRMLEFIDTAIMELETISGISEHAIVKTLGSESLCF